MIALVFGLIAHRTDESRSALILQWENGEEIGGVQRDVEFAVHRWSARQDVGNVEEVVVRSTWKADFQHSPHRRISAVASCEVSRRARLDAAVWSFQARKHIFAAVLEAREFRPALDLHPVRGQTIEQQAFV